MHFLFKEEPTNYSYDAFVKDGKATWTSSSSWRRRIYGVRALAAAPYAVTGSDLRKMVRDPDGRVQDIKLVLGAVASRPLGIPAAEALIRGQVLTDDLIAAAADAAYPAGKPMDNTDYELIWRKKMIRALVTYALKEVRGDDVREQRGKIARQLL